MWDRFKNWKKDNTSETVCPLCQHKNPKKAETCKSCSYQLNKPSHEQISSIEESEKNSLFDQLMDEFDIEKEDEIIDWSKATFKMDDVTVDVNQYTEEEEVFLSSKPSFAMTKGTIEMPKQHEQQEDYQLSPDDAPSIPVKFEIPVEQPEIIEEVEYTPVELIKPTSGTPDNVQIISADQITEEISEITILDAADFDGDGDVDEYEEAFFNDENNEEVEIVDEIDSDNNFSIIPSAPLDLPPFIKSENILIEKEDNNVEDEIITLPSAPVISSINENPISSNKVDNKISYWPWMQQDEWMFSELKDQVLSAMRAAIDKNIAQATVIIDDVGPHLGNQTNLMYPIGKLLDTIGRRNAVDKMITLASKNLPNDPNVIQAKQKLRP